MYPFSRAIYIYNIIKIKNKKIKILFFLFSLTSIRVALEKGYIPYTLR